MPAADESGTVEIVLQLSPDATLPSTATAQAVRRTAAEIGVDIEAIHPDTDDAELATWARAVVPAAQAEQIVTRLAATPGVAAAYVKPSGTTP